jgi:Leucine-rich repeat (LRR) protein
MPGEWVHVAGVFDGRRISLYIDGQLTNSQEFARSPVLRGAEPFRTTGKLPTELQDSGTAFSIGSGFQGLIDDVRLWNVALNARQIASLAVGERPAASDEQDREVAAWVMGLGGDVSVVVEGQETTLKPGDQLPAGTLRLTGVNLDDRPTKVHDADLARFAPLGRLRRLGLRGNPITDAGLTHIKDLTGLTHLNLHATGITSAGVAQLADLTGLQALDIAYNKNINDEALTHMAKLRRLKTLNLWATLVTGQTLDVLKDCPELLFLELESAQVTDEGLAKLATIGSLKYIELQGNRITDAGLEHLTKLTRLTNLNLANNTLTDAALPHLARMPSLRTVRLGRAAVTAEGLAQLKKALPMLEVHRRED